MTHHIHETDAAGHCDWCLPALQSAGSVKGTSPAGLMPKALGFLVKLKDGD